MEYALEKPQRNIQSIEVGGQLLLALLRNGGQMLLRDLAHEAGMPPGKAHPYLVSFGNLGLVQQDDVTGQYELGPLALQLGLASLRRLNPLKEAEADVKALAAKTGQGIFISIWGNLGPTVVRLEESNYPIHVSIRNGTVMSLANTATGQIFSAFMPLKLIEKMMLDDLPRLAGGASVTHETVKKFEQSLIDVRRRGLARVVGHPIPGVNALSAPVFDHNGNIVLAITAMGITGVFDPAWKGDMATALRACAGNISARLGYTSTAGKSDRLKP
ncbi:IclR family transcriptional regulator [Paraherbaspirillum soli]|uniref:IclR family transcriptional regulator n=1 Tax=Paraherbaspirillum soli TaxID=631222 RepID=A0ABW0MB53_9BURK